MAEHEEDIENNLSQQSEYETGFVQLVKPVSVSKLLSASPHFSNTNDAPVLKRDNVHTWLAFQAVRRGRNPAFPSSSPIMSINNGRDCLNKPVGLLPPIGHEPKLTSIRHPNIDELIEKTLEQLGSYLNLLSLKWKYRWGSSEPTIRLIFGEEVKNCSPERYMEVDGIIKDFNSWANTQMRNARDFPERERFRELTYMITDPSTYTVSLNSSNYDLSREMYQLPIQLLPDLNIDGSIARVKLADLNPSDQEKWLFGANLFRFGHPLFIDQIPEYKSRADKLERLRLKFSY